MFFKTHNRINPATGKLSIYYRLAENNRDVSGSIKQQSIMGVGFMDDIDKEELDRIADCLNARVCGVQTLFKDENEKVRSVFMLTNCITGWLTKSASTVRGKPVSRLPIATCSALTSTASKPVRFAS